MKSVSSTIQNELLLFGDSFLLGAALMLVYDLLRMGRRLKKRGVLWVSIEDLIYWLFFVVAVFVLLYRQNDGAFRLFVVIGIASGLLIYYLLISRRAIPFMEKIIQKVRKSAEKRKIVRKNKKKIEKSEKRV